ncbi:Uncharacterized protein BC141101_05887 [Bacillus toyonensis]|uniref:hypothetical protein n=1 Tax=Bacillus toyonensis TaxID=155322 RepID=UPI00027BE9AC|nr:hypothetical protein [Bacillus toyonensis]OTX28590.1 hypothetical protein BK717_28790 [Bacillus thuringiensis serovar malayensis]EJV41930.1 hypothetical protein IEA_05558 [Bacillus toyonensis]EJV89890.1 hypothetical protein IGI_05534 [Bacillus toyonensis]EOP32051.1 hypothetical protein IG5_05714 [Bacillus toyonensis]MBE7138659.1 hypothetical protein [Bacillus toyonensis]
MATSPRRNKVEKAPYQDAVTVILKRKGMTYEDWSREIVNNICVSVIQGGNSEWKNKMLEAAAMEVIADSVVEQEEKRQNHTNN